MGHWRGPFEEDGEGFGAPARPFALVTVEGGAHGGGKIAAMVVEIAAQKAWKGVGAHIRDKVTEARERMEQEIRDAFQGRRPGTDPVWYVTPAVAERLRALYREGIERAAEGERMRTRGDFIRDLERLQERERLHDLAEQLGGAFTQLAGSARQTAQAFENFWRDLDGCRRRAGFGDGVTFGFDYIKREAVREPRNRKPGTISPEKFVRIQRYASRPSHALPWDGLQFAGKRPEVSGIQGPQVAANRRNGGVYRRVKRGPD